MIINNKPEGVQEGHASLRPDKNCNSNGEKMSQAALSQHAWVTPITLSRFFFLRSSSSIHAHIRRTPLGSRGVVGARAFLAPRFRLSVSRPHSRIPISATRCRPVGWCAAAVIAILIAVSRRTRRIPIADKHARAGWHYRMTSVAKEYRSRSKSSV